MTDRLKPNGMVDLSTGQEFDRRTEIFWFENLIKGAFCIPGGGDPVTFGYNVFEAQTNPPDPGTFHVSLNYEPHWMGYGPTSMEAVIDLVRTLNKAMKSKKIPHDVAMKGLKKYNPRLHQALLDNPDAPEIAVMFGWEFDFEAH